MNSGKQARSPILSFWQIFLLVLAICTGISYPAAKHADATWSIDSESYLKMAKGNYDVTTTHRYRPLIPLISGGLYTLGKQVLSVIWPDKSKDNDRMLRYCFYLVNLILFALAATVIGFQSYTVFDGQFWPVVVAIAIVCSSRWTVYTIGVPLTDSLYLLLLALFWYYGMAGKNLWLVVLMGPFAKETFVMFLPLIFLFPTSKHSLATKLLMVLSALVVLVATRWGIDSIYGPPVQSDFANIGDHLVLITDHMKLLISVNGIGQLFGTFGLFTTILLLPFLPVYKKYRRSLWESLRPFLFPFVTYGVVVAIHILLSGDFSRMFFFSVPVFVWLACYILRPFLRRHMHEI